MNELNIAGYMCNVSELRNTQNGIPCKTFSVAVKRDYSDKSGERQTDFIPCVAYRTTATFIDKYFGKGDAITLNGSLQSRKYTDKEGKSRTAYEVVVNKVWFALGGKKDSAPVDNGIKWQETDMSELLDDSDLPF